ncbi:MAG TPA: hypothetical protein PKD95_02335 [Candidatus Paceibacterota bacterium]|nr:hypothetical protein [Candidatus Paceibacterota bacterium]
MKTNTNCQQKNLSQGYLLVMVLVFGSILFVIISSFFAYIVTQGNAINQRVELQRSLDIAEAGLNYYKWFLAHYPNDVTNGTGMPGPYVHTYYDPEGDAIGEFSLEIASSTYCGDVASIDVSSTGHTYDDPSVYRTVSARYARPSVAEYSYIINSNVWAGADRIIVGPYHSNGGIRMDGQNNSTVTSGQESWNCDFCSPAEIRDGVFTTTANANPALFSFPSAPINFAGLTIDLAQMQNRAQFAGGIYIGPSGAYGYRVTFNSNGTITVRRVNGTTEYWGLTSEAGWVQERHVISSTNTNNTYTIPASCPIIFVQDKVWLDGVVNQKVTIAAADVGSTAINPQIILNGNITYTSATTSGLLAIAEQDVLVGLVVPTDMTLNGIFVAQNGRFGINRYCENCSSGGINRGLPNSLDPYVFRNSLTVNGTIVSNGREGTKWTSGGTWISGFNNRVNSYDRNLVNSPPPLVPKTSDVFVITEWRDHQ